MAWWSFRCCAANQLSQTGRKTPRNVNLHGAAESSFGLQGLNMIMKGGGERQKASRELEDCWDLNLGYFLFKSAGRFS